jgi:hypothetical protein
MDAEKKALQEEVCTLREIQTLTANETIRIKNEMGKLTEKLKSAEATAKEQTGKTERLICFLIEKLDEERRLLLSIRNKKKNDIAKTKKEGEAELFAIINLFGEARGCEERIKEIEFFLDLIDCWERENTTKA